MTLMGLQRAGAALSFFLLFLYASAVEFDHRFLIPFNLSTADSNTSSGAQIIYIAALIPDESDSGILFAFRLALEEIAASDLLPKDVELRMVYVVTQCLPANSTKDLFDLLYYLPRAFVLFGTACRGLTGPVSQISYFWNITMVSYADTSPELSDETKYRNLVRVVPSDAEFNFLRVGLFRALNWTKCGTIYQDSARHNQNSFVTSQNAAASAHLDDLMKTIETDKSTTKDVKFSSFTTALTGLKKLQKLDYRIMSAILNEDSLGPLFCAIHQLGMYGAKHVWILSGFRASKNVWSEEHLNCNKSVCNCSYSNLLKAANFSLHIDFLTISKDIKELSPLQLHYRQEFIRQKLLYSNPYHAYAFDGVKTVAQATSNMLKNTSMTQLDGLRSLQFQDYISEVNLQGVTGGVQFQKKSRMGVLVLRQLIVHQVPGDDQIKLRFLASFNASSKTFSVNISDAISWPSGKAPRDRTTVQHSLVTVHLPVFIVFCALAIIGLVLCIVIISINIKFRYHRYIKMSSPRMNNLIVLGCVLCYASIVFQGLDAGVLRQNSKAFTYICSTRAWVLSIGFTLAFGSMFSKTWRVHCIFTNISMNKKMIKDYQLMLIVILLLCIDFCILITWMIVDPLQLERKVQIKTLSNDRELHLSCEVCVSSKQSLWFGLLSAYKGLLLLIGCFFAWETRHRCCS